MCCFGLCLQISGMFISSIPVTMFICVNAYIFPLLSLYFYMCDCFVDDCPYIVLGL